MKSAVADFIKGRKPGGNKDRFRVPCAGIGAPDAGNQGCMRNKSIRGGGRSKVLPRPVKLGEESR